MGQSVAQFYSTRICWFFDALEGFSKAKLAQNEFDFLLVRQQTAMFVNTQLTKAHQITDLEQFWGNPFKEKTDAHESEEQKNKREAALLKAAQGL